MVDHKKLIDIENRKHKRMSKEEKKKIRDELSEVEFEECEDED